MTRTDQHARMERTIALPLAAVGAVLALALLRPAPLLAAGVVGTGTAESCSEAEFDTALAGGGMVTFDCGSDPVTISASRKEISADTTIDGGGRITIGGDQNRILTVSEGVTLGLHGVTVTGGSQFDGTIANRGTLIVIDSTFVDNSALGFPFGDGVGGAIANHGGTLEVTNSTFAGNIADGGGAIWNGPNGRLDVTNSTFFANSAGAGGAINNQGTLTVTNCTFAANSANPGFGGTIYVTAGNSSSFRNTILAGGVSGENCAGAITDGGHNIDDGASCGFSTANGSRSDTDAGLDPAGLSDGGGPTRTIALLPGSPAIDAGDPEVCANPPVSGLDQRGYVRPGIGSTNCSIGAYEYDSPSARVGCAGNCDEKGSVSVGELVTLVNVALGIADFGACAGGDANDDGTVTIEEIVAAVDAALSGCTEIEEATIAELQAAMERGRSSALDLVERYLARIETIDRKGPTLRSVIEVNPDAPSIAADLDSERQDVGARGPLHGIPVQLKDNVDTGDRMLTTAGSLALIDAPATSDATVAERLREAGAVLLGKTNLSEWANMRSLRATSGWSARGGQTLNPYALDRSPCGSSSGSAVAVAANLCAVAIGTETDGSIVCPAAANGIVGLKPTVGLTSRAGVVPLAHTQDTVGILARTVADAATVLGALVGPDPRDPATQASAGHVFDDYTQFLDPGGLRGARIGVPRQVFFGGDAASDAIAEQAIAALRDAGATVVDPADIPTAATLASDPSEFRVLLYEFKADLNSYLATRSGLGVATLADLIAFNLAHADTELALFGQEIFYLANPLGSLETAAYLTALGTSLRLSRDEGIDAVMDQYQLDALIAPTGPPPWVIDYGTGDPPLPYPLHSIAARAGCPVITVPAGFADGLPVGVSFVGRAFSEPTLIRLAYAFERLTRARHAPRL